MARLREIPKYVFSSTLERADWDNTTIVGGDAVEAVRELKAGGDGDLVAYGYGALSQALRAPRGRLALRRRRQVPPSTDGRPSCSSTTSSTR
jgi:hypothetical protein